jgi:O-antigen/teichoic acid export membrane protein
MNPAGPPTAPPAPPPPPQSPSPAVSTIRRDLFSAYAASGARVLSWVVVSALVYRASPAHFAVLALVRGTLVLLNYTTVGLLPALVRLLATTRSAADAAAPLPPPGGVLEYARAPGTALRAVYANAMILALGAGAVGQLLVLAYVEAVDVVHHIPGRVPGVPGLVFSLGIGIILRLISDAPAAVLQTAGAIALDNLLVILSEVAWVAGTLVAYGASNSNDFILASTSASYAASGLMLLLARVVCAGRLLPFNWPELGLLDRTIMRTLLGTGSLVALAQFADFLYAPVDYILINRLISAEAVAAYAPVVQVNGGLLLLVGALSAVMLPRAAVAHAAGDAGALRRYYLRGTLAAAGMLAAASVAVWLLAPRIFTLWLGDPLPAAQAVLPLVLLHTVLGGSGGVGRSILLAAGKAKPYAAAVLTAGAGHVVLSYVFVRFFGWGLGGVALGTVAAAVGLCVLWQPWYVLRTLRNMRAADAADAGAIAEAGVAPPPPPEPL